VVDGQHFTRAEDVANLAAMAKHEAKLSTTGLHETVLA
jgi:hypothetical protein